MRKLRTLYMVEIKVPGRGWVDDFGEGETTGLVFLRLRDALDEAERRAEELDDTPARVVAFDRETLE